MEACRSSKSGSDPFLAYDFFFFWKIANNSVGPKTGWVPFYIIFKRKKYRNRNNGKLLKKSFPREYVFDHS